MKKIKQEVYDITCLSNIKPSLHIAKGIKKYKREKGKWIENPKVNRLKMLYGVRIKKVREYEIK